MEINKLSSDSLFHNDPREPSLAMLYTDRSMFALYSDPTRLRKRQRVYEKGEYSIAKVIEKSRLYFYSCRRRRCLQGSLHARWECSLPLCRRYWHPDSGAHHLRLAQIGAGI